jgi:hypothetical protein
MFVAQGLTTLSCLPESVNFTPLFFSRSTLNGETVMTFVEPSLEDLASLVPYFEIEGNGFRLVAFTVLLVEAVCVA